MKTAMQELLEYLQKDYDGLDKQKNEVSKIMKIAVATIMRNIEDLYISKEKEQIMEAFVAGDERGTKEIPFNAEQYFQQTYKSDE